MVRIEGWDEGLAWEAARRWRNWTRIFASATLSFCEAQLARPGGAEGEGGPLLGGEFVRTAVPARRVRGGEGGRLEEESHPTFRQVLVESPAPPSLREG